jgi:hypothetical protein
VQNLKDNLVRKKRREQLQSPYHGDRANKVQNLKDNLVQKKRWEQLQSLESKQNRVRTAEHKDHGIKIRCTCKRWSSKTEFGVDHHLSYCPLFSIKEESSQAEEVEDLGIDSMAAQVHRLDEQQVRESKSSVEEDVNQQLSLLEKHLEEILSETSEELSDCHSLLEEQKQSAALDRKLSFCIKVTEELEREQPNIRQPNEGVEREQAKY